MSEWVTISEAAKLAGRSKHRIYQWIKSGYLEARKDIHGRKVVQGKAVLDVEAKIPGGNRWDLR